MAVKLQRPPIFASMPDEGHVVVEASAGTGKTWTIERLVIDLLLRERCQIDEILVVTFTVRATHELKIRIRDTLAAILDSEAELAEDGAASDEIWEIDEDARQHLSKALARFDTAPIHTIHAFCQRVLTEHAFECGRPFAQEVVATEEAFAQAFRTALRREIAADEELRPLLLHWLRKKTVADLEAVLRDHHRRQGELRPQIDKSRIEGMIDAAKRLRAILEEPHARQDLHQAWDQAPIGTHSTNAATDQITELAKALSRFNPDQWGDLVADVDELELVQIYDPESAHTTLFSEQPFHEHLPEKAREFALAVADLDRHLIPLDAAAIQWFLPAVDAELTTLKAERGWLDHDDMLTALRDALKSERGHELIAALRQRFSFALIDEFQDTDIVQWEVFEELFVKHGGHGRLFIIGDPKQAIYSFRGGDVATYLAARRTLASPERPPIRLRDNFRSTEQLLDGLNTLFDQEAEQPFFTGEIRYDAPVRCGRPELRATDHAGKPLPPVSLLNVVTQPGTKLGAPDIKERVMRCMAREIVRLLTPEGAVYVHDDSEGESRRVMPRDIFILTRTNHEANDVASWLRASGVPFAFFKRDGLFQTPEARDVRDVLLAVAHPRRRSARMRAWYTPFFGVPLDRLQDCLNLPETHPLVARLYSWQALASQRDYERLFAAILSESGVIRREILLRDSERELTNYLHLFEVLLDEANRARGTLDDLIVQLSSFIEERQKPPGSDADIQRIESEREAVQIMTIHKAKGLEAGVVFVYGGFTRGRNRPPFIYHVPDEDGGQTRIIGLELPDTGPERVRWIEEEREENQRLLYVALTRARARLYLPYYDLDSLKSRSLSYFEDSAYETLRRRLEAVAAQLTADDALAARFQVLPVEDTRPDAPVDPDLEALPDWHPPDDLLDPSPATGPDAELHTRRLVITSYSRMKQQGHSSDPTDRAAFTGEAQTQPGIELTDEELPGGPASGAFIHAILENIPVESLASRNHTEEDFESWKEEEPVAALINGTLARHGMPEKLFEPAARMVFGAFKAPVELGDEKLDSGLAAAPRQLAELEFHYPIPEADHSPIGDPTAALPGIRVIRRGWVKGFIDLLFQWNDRVYFLDWKTDVLPAYNRTVLDAHVAEHYRWQARLYSLAVVRLLEAHAPDLYDERFGGFVYAFTRGMQVGAGESAGIWFSRPDWQTLQEWERELQSHQFS